jgi:hypothetical protein
MAKKTTNVDLVKILHERNKNREYDALIVLAARNHYHDYKSEAAAPKMELINDLSIFPELKDVSERVMQGEFDESPDESDKDELRDWLKNDPNGDILKDILGL